MSEGQRKGKARSFGAIDAALIGAMFIWGANMIAVKAALDEMNPLAFNALRFVIAVGTMFLVVLYAERDISVSIPDLKWLLLTGLLGNTMYQLLFINGINLSTAGNTAFMMATAPVWVAVMGSMWAGERLERVQWLGVLVSFAGVFLIIVGGGETIAISTHTLRGDMLTLTGAVCWAGYTLMTRPVLRVHSPLKVTAYAMGMGSVPLLLISLPSLGAQDWSQVSINGWALLIFSSLGALVIGYMVWAWGVRVIGGTRTAIYNNLPPIVAGLLGFFVMGEDWTLLRLAGAIAILAGLCMVRSFGKEIEIEHEPGN